MNQNRISLSDLLAQLQNGDENIRAKALDECVALGAEAVPPLAELMDKPGFETARMAKRCLWKIVRYSGKPGEDKLRKSVCEKLAESLKNATTNTKREILWMLSEIGNNNSVPVIEKFLTDKDLRDDARCSLQRIPAKEALQALKRAFENATDDFKFALADSLRARGMQIKDFPSKKLVPTRQTSVGKKA